MIALCFAMLDDGDEDKFRRFYKRYIKLVLYILNDILHDSHLAEDVASDCFIMFAEMFYKIRDVDSKETENYVIIATRHKGFKMYNKRKKEPEFIDIDSLDAEDPYVFEEHVMGDMMEERIYEEVLMKLPEKYYEVLYLSVVLDFTPQDIAKTLDISVDNAYKRINRARKVVDNMLKED